MDIYQARLPQGGIKLVSYPTKMYSVKVFCSTLFSGWPALHLNLTSLDFNTCTSCYNWGPFNHQRSKVRSMVSFYMEKQAPRGMSISTIATWFEKFPEIRRLPVFFSQTFCCTLSDRHFIPLLRIYSPMNELISVWVRDPRIQKEDFWHAYLDYEICIHVSVLNYLTNFMQSQVLLSWRKCLIRVNLCLPWCS